MLDRPVHMSFYSPGELRKNLTSAYVFKPQGRWKWLQGKLWAFLMRRGALSPYFSDEYVVSEVFQPREKTLELLKVLDNQLRSMGRRPTTLLVGAKDFWDTRKEAFYSQQMMDYGMSYTAEDVISVAGVPYPLKVIIIPNMEGMVLVDDRVKV